MSSSVPWSSCQLAGGRSVGGITPEYQASLWTACSLCGFCNHRLWGGPVLYSIVQWQCSNHRTNIGLHPTISHVSAIEPGGAWLVHEVMYVLPSCGLHETTFASFPTSVLCSAQSWSAAYLGQWVPILCHPLLHKTEHIYIILAWRLTISMVPWYPQYSNIIQANWSYAHFPWKSSTQVDIGPIIRTAPAQWLSVFWS